MLAALAPVTERVTLGTGALLPFLRRPIQAAQSLASVDLLSGGQAHGRGRRRLPGPLRTAVLHAVRGTVGAPFLPAGRHC